MLVALAQQTIADGHTLSWTEVVAIIACCAAVVAIAWINRG